MTPTPEQLAIIEAVRTNAASIMVTAYAGCAKTSTIVMAAQHIKEPCIALAFNVKIKDDLITKLPPHFKVQTLNGLGHQALAKALNRRLIVDSSKLYNLLKEEFRGENLTDDDFSDVLALVRAARNVGLVPLGMQGKGLVPDTEETWQDLAEGQMVELNNFNLDIAHRLLVLSIDRGLKGLIDFDDQVYLSVCFTGIFPRYQRLITDEAQDLSPLNHIQIRKVAYGGKIIAVGDPKQAIYAFRGADSSSMTNLRKLSPTWLDFPLTTTFRCSKAVVERQKHFVQGFNAFETNKVGAIVDLRLASWDLDNLPKAGNLAVLCRNNAPIIAFALKLLGRGIGVAVLGRDIGKSLIKLVGKICGKDKSYPASLCAMKITEWLHKEIGKAESKGQRDRVAGLNDRAQALLAVIDYSEAKDLGEIEKKLQALFANDSGQVTLVTGHRAKGLEWDNVIHLNSNLIPSKYAKAAAEEGNMTQWEQDMNLKYVIETRAKDTLILAHLDDFEGGDK